MCFEAGRGAAWCFHAVYGGTLVSFIRDVAGYVPLNELPPRLQEDDVHGFLTHQAFVHGYELVLVVAADHVFNMQFLKKANSCLG